MATKSTSASASPTPNYFAKTGGLKLHHHYRRPSLKKTLMPASPGVSAPRTQCPKDVDAFSYNPSHLPAWIMPQDLWEHLPLELRPHLVGVQHAGAAVLTGLERLKEIRMDLLAHLAELEESQDAPKESDDPTERELDALLNNWNLDTTIKEDWRRDSLLTLTLPTPALTPPCSEIAGSDKSANSSMPGTPLGTSPTSPAFAPTPIPPFVWPVNKPSRPHTPPPTSPPLASPFSAPEPETMTMPTTPTTKTPESQTAIHVPTALRPFVQPPRNPHSAYYAAELAELRCVALVRLRHASRRIDAEWGECKRVGIVQPSERAEDAQTAKEFDLWWRVIKGLVAHLEERVRRIEQLGMGLAGLS